MTLDPISAKNTTPSYTNTTCTANHYSATTEGGASFEEALATASITFSNHAQKRLESRDIRLAGDDLSKLATAVDKATTKGAKDSLVLLDDLAFVVSVKNRTVITAMNLPDFKEGVVTKIDSVVIA